MLKDTIPIIKRMFVIGVLVLLLAFLALLIVEPYIAPLLIPTETQAELRARCGGTPSCPEGSKCYCID